MLGEADAALLIGDAALRVDPATLPFETLDLGGEWIAMTGLPMVFAVWSGRKEIVRRSLRARLRRLLPLRPGAHRRNRAQRNRPRAASTQALVRKYLTRAHRVRAGRARLRRAWSCILKQASRFEPALVEGVSA